MADIDAVAGFLGNISIHRLEVAQLCALLAYRRGLDAPLTRACGLLHDIYVDKTGISMCHAESGADMVRIICNHELKDAFSDTEKNALLSAIWNHSDKGAVHGPYDEILKDADSLQRCLRGEPVKPDAGKRAIKTMEELGMKGEMPVEYVPEPVQKGFDREKFAKMAEDIAMRHVKGSRDNPEYMRLISYFPEGSAFDELDHSWCAAFVYHCAVSSGLILPIRLPLSTYSRFTGVRAWVELGDSKGWSFKPDSDIQPQRGDIIIYDNVLPASAKPANCPWHDHIGIVVGARGDELMAAEGNSGNTNTAHLVPRNRHRHIGRFVRIPDGTTTVAR